MEYSNANNVTPTYANTSLFNIGSSGTSTLFWQGNVGEVIVYSGRHTAADYSKVESYLALKWGISKSSDYIASGGTNYWTTASNSGYNNNVSGIGRDDNSGLYQKQSQSQNSGSQLLIGAGGALANTNAANINTLTDGQFLVWGDNGLAKIPSVAISGISGVNFRFNAIWKVQNTATVATVRVMWPQGLTNLKLVQSPDESFESTDIVTDMSANTQTINGVTYNYADVTLANGQFFTFVSYVAAPGGTTANLQLWLKGDVGISGTIWNDQSINGRNAVATGTPTVSTYINFNPAASVNGSNYYSVAHNEALNQDAGNRMTLAVVATAPTGSYGILVNKHVGPNWDEGWGMAQQGNTNNNMGFWTGNWTGAVPNNPAYVTFTPNIPSLFFGYSTAATGNSNFLSYNGGTAVASANAVNTQTNTVAVKIGNQSGGTASYSPQIAEVIMYS